jgi:hypothetical protein
LRRSKPHLGPGASVETDWFGGLPEDQLHAFRIYARELEAPYLMFSVSLDEAISLRKSGSLAKSFQVVVLTSALCGRLTELLENMLRSLAEHCKHRGMIPSVAPLNPADFHSKRGQRSALKSFLLSGVFLSRHAQFLSKIRALRVMVADIGHNFCSAAEDVVSRGATVESAQLWAAMDAGHFDLNTCLRESIVLLKCFLRALPAETNIQVDRGTSRINPCKPRTLENDTTVMLR